ncbi:hypothetical protein LINGRAHAP2_LOCUS33159 [Linum grandiflorum]
MPRRGRATLCFFSEASTSSLIPSPPSPTILVMLYRSILTIAINGQVTDEVKELFPTMLMQSQSLDILNSLKRGTAVIHRLSSSKHINFSSYAEIARVVLPLELTSMEISLGRSGYVIIGVL